MSPTAIISSVVAALIIFAWVFQSETKDPGFEEYKRQQAAKDQEVRTGAAPVNTGVVVSNPKVSRMENAVLVGARRTDAAPGQTESPGVLTTNTDPVASPDDKNNEPENDPSHFRNGARLNGTYMAPAEEASITFNFDGTFTTQNMAQADVDMEAGATAVGTRDVSSGRYWLGRTTLKIDYNDGLKRRKGDHRVFTVLPMEGPTDAPAAISIQGKVFKLAK